MIYLYVLGGLWLLFKTTPYLVALLEKEHIRRDLEPREVDPVKWGSEYLNGKMAEARSAGLAPCGSFFTARHSSLVKGPMLLYRRSEDGGTLVALVSARIGGGELRKVEVTTLFEDGTAILTCDNSHIPDFTGVVEKETCYNATLVDMLTRHDARLLQAQKKAVRVPTGGELDHLERIETKRAEAMVAGGFARWADPAQTTLRRTWRGALRAVAANREHGRKLVRDEMHKARRAKAAPPPRSGS